MLCLATRHTLPMIAPVPQDVVEWASHLGGCGSMALEWCKASMRRVCEWFGCASDGLGACVVAFSRQAASARRRFREDARRRTRARKPPPAAQGRTYPQLVQSTLAWATFAQRRRPIFAGWNVQRGVQR